MSLVALYLLRSPYLNQAFFHSDKSEYSPILSPQSIIERSAEMQNSGHNSSATTNLTMPLPCRYTAGFRKSFTPWSRRYVCYTQPGEPSQAGPSRATPCRAEAQR